MVRVKRKPDLLIAENVSYKDGRLLQKYWGKKGPTYLIKVSRRRGGRYEVWLQR